MRIEAHRGTDLASLLPRSHVPHDPLRVGRRAAINEAVSLLGSLDSVSIDAGSTEIHARCSHHLRRMVHLLKPFAIEVRLLDRSHRHFLYERRYSSAIVANKSLLCSLYVQIRISENMCKNLQDALRRFELFIFAILMSLVACHLLLLLALLLLVVAGSC